jgi:hypothetical protein
MSCPTRDKILERIATLLGSRIVRWSDARTSRGDFEGSQWTIDVFDVPGEESFELGRRIAAYRRELSREYGIGLVVVPHTPEATDQHFPWVRKGEVDSCEPSTYATSATIAVSNAPFARPRTTVEFGIQR